MGIAPPTQPGKLQAIQTPWRNRSPRLGTFGWLCVGLSLVMLDLGILDGKSGMSASLAGHTNGEFPAMLVFFGTCFLFVAAGLVGLLCILIGGAIPTRRHAWALGALAVVLAAPWFVVTDGPTGYTGFERAFQEWAQNVPAGPILKAAAAAAPPAALPTPPPYWWIMQNRDAPCGVSIARVSFTARCPDVYRMRSAIFLRMARSSCHGGIGTRRVFSC